MLNATITPEHKVWRSSDKLIFRIVFIYFVLQIFPLDWKYYRHLFSLNWLDLSFREIFQLSKYTPQFLSATYDPNDWGLATFADWGFIFVFALLGALIWSALDKKSQNEEKLYAYLRIGVRYRLAIAVIAYGFLKLFQLQAPYPSISSLNTPYGDFTSWKLFSLSLGIVPGYQSFLGAVELIAGFLLLFRRTSVIGATIIIFFLGNVFMSNLAYEGGEVVYSFYLVVLALFLVAYDAERIVKLIVLHVPVSPAGKVLQWNKQQRVVRLVLKSALVLVFVVLYGFSAQRSAAKGSYLFSAGPGLKELKGWYVVTKFETDGAAGSLQWQDVVFEQWATLSVKVNETDTVWNDNVEQVPLADSLSLFETAGTTGRRYYDYAVDTAKQVLLLSNKRTHKEVGQLHYILQPDATLRLNGRLDGTKVDAVLQKKNKVYLLEAAKKVGRREGLTL